MTECMHPQHRHNSDYSGNGKQVTQRYLRNTEISNLQRFVGGQKQVSRFDIFMHYVLTV